MTNKNIQHIPTGWKETTLKEVIFPVSDTFDFTNVGKVHFLNTGDILDGKLLHTDLVNPLSLPGQAKKKFRKGDILYSEIRPANKRYMLVDFDSSNSVASTKLMVLRAKDNIDTKFIYQILTAQNTLDEFQFIAESRSGTFPQITFDAISSFPICLPLLPEQRAIASVLSAFDDKIELLREQNKTLEAIAQTLFKRWFVEFNFPDENGQPYCDSGGKMIDSELGEIPEGWRVGKLGEVANISIGRTPPRKEEEWFSINPKDKKWISIKDLGGVTVYIFNTAEYLTEDAVEKFNIPIIPKGTVILSFKLTVGRVAITSEEMLSNEAIAHIKDLKGLDTEFVYLFLQNLNFDSLGSTSSIATAINTKTIKEINVILPKGKTIKEFSSIVKPLFERIFNNISQIQTLSQLRDSILPKLMRGEVRVKH